MTNAEMFNKICQYYECTGSEIELMRATANEHPKDAVICFNALIIEIQEQENNNLKCFSDLQPSYIQDTTKKAVKNESNRSD